MDDVPISDGVHRFNFKNPSESFASSFVGLLIQSSVSGGGESGFRFRLLLCVQTVMNQHNITPTFLHVQSGDAVARSKLKGESTSVSLNMKNTRDKGTMCRVKCVKDHATRCLGVFVSVCVCSASVSASMGMCVMRTCMRVCVCVCVCVCVYEPGSCVLLLIYIISSVRNDYLCNTLFIIRQLHK